MSHDATSAVAVAEREHAVLTADERLRRMRAFALPAGEEAARLVRAVRFTQRGEIRAAPTARWIRFTAEQTMQAQWSAFRWVARPQRGLFRMATVVDAYEGGHGELTIRVAGAPLATSRGADFDRGEIQRYLAELPMCPPALIAHPGLRWEALDGHTLRVTDGSDPTGATVDVEVALDGRVVRCSAVRPRAIGKGTAMTPWWGTYEGEREWDGLRVPIRVEVSWRVADESFTYFRAEITALSAVR